MQIRRLTTVLCTSVLFFNGANAQNASFETYSEALSSLLGAGSANCGFGVVPFDDDLTILEGNDQDAPARTGLIGPNLSRHCFPNTNNSNLSGGSVIGGSLSSLQSTRTVSQFDITRRRTAPCDPAKDPKCKEDDSENTAVSNYFYHGSITSSGNSFLSLVNDNDDVINAIGFIPLDSFSIFGQLEYQSYRQSASKFEPQKKVDIFTAEAGAIWDVSVDSVVGIKGLYSNGNGTSPRPETVTILGEGLLAGQVFTGNFENLCGVPSEGSIDTNEFEGSIFYQTTLMQDGFINAELGLSKTRLKYRNSFCTINLTDKEIAPDVKIPVPIEERAGIISGNPNIIGLSTEINAGYDWRYNGVVVGPRLSFSANWRKVESYSESEEPGSLDHPITGASLHYGDQDISSIQTRVGFAISKPLAYDTMIVVPFLQLDYIHEFANDQRTVWATFVEDGRPDPFEFTFKTNPPDRDFFEIRTGIVAEIFSGGLAYFDGRAILANELVDNYGVTGGLRISF
ncbi:autotransporter outer membrane beta-barrel domain-containing protein [Ensifer adhaerens]|uniref:autotransporter outer membrane beta-barrel domain-containing protein n=1 Tax=Ensifer adhaerens TaxID=106592 RepID=UPI00131A0EAD|nr:autotransporter outer membrane beta-barrel domain-containing protein [Ensifer adhaerens]